MLIVQGIVGGNFGYADKENVELFEQEQPIAIELEKGFKTKSYGFNAMDEVFWDLKNAYIILITDKGNVCLPVT